MALFLFLTLPLLRQDAASGVETQAARVRQALTGDSLLLENGKTLKYIGVRSPSPQSKTPLERQYGNKALELNQKWVGGKTVQIQWDFQIRDNRSNLLGYVFLEDGTFVNLEILKAGYGKARVTAPNKKYAADFRRAEFDARRKKIGLWLKEPENPFLRSRYVGEKNTKVYYFSTSPELDRIPQANLIFFDSRVEAKAAGYKPCRNCREDQDTAEDAALSEEGY